MAEKEYQDIHVLVVEDDNFQRLALIDILTLCDYQVTAVENGRIARDELLKESSNFDIVLLDLQMPEMDGFELLTLMQDQERLKIIPVIMMSFGDEQENLTKCLSNGAKDFLVKPLRIQSVKGLAKYVEPNPINQSPSSGLKGLQQYQCIRTIGQGAGGSVDLVKRRHDGQFFAMKTISMKIMDDLQKRMAQQEVTLLRVLVTPSIIRYFESFVENESIYIVMEYAQQGALYDRIRELKIQGTPMDEETILYFTAQVVISVLFMHSKNILHRDIKSQNLFMTKENIVKLGDFGISKALVNNGDQAKTLVGTPQFMSPEVCSGEPYGQKADIWALGCTLYEMVMLRRPFDSENDNLNVLFTKIKTEDPPPLRENVGTDIRMLITQMLQKNPQVRPSVWDLGKIPIIRENIRKYCLAEAPNDSFLLEYIGGNNNQSQQFSGFPSSQSSSAASTPSTTTTTTTGSTGPQSTTSSSTSSASSSSLMHEQTIMALSESLQPYDQKISMFHVERSVVNGVAIFKWFNIYYPNCMTQELVQKLEELVEKKYIHHIFGPKFKNDPLSLYRFQSDMPGVPANHYKIWNKQARFGNEILRDCIQHANAVLFEVSDQFNGIIDEDQLIKSKKYIKFLDSVCELQKVFLQDLKKENELKCFFVNFVQIMYFHKYFHSKYTAKKNSLKTKVNTIQDTLLSFIPFLGKSEEVFEYQIGYHTFTLDDVKHGILRGNIKHRQSKFRPFRDDDERKQFVLPQPIDLRVLFLFKEDNVLPPELKFIALETIEAQLNDIAAKFFSHHVCIDPVENDITLHRLFSIYLEDFGGSPKEILFFAAKHSKLLMSASDLASSIEQGETFVQFNDKFIV